MRISDWSSYVFSSDLPITLIVEIDAAFPVGDKIFQFQQPLAITRDQRPGHGELILGIIGVGAERCLAAEHFKSISQDPIGRASCRERVGRYVYVSGVEVQIKKKHRKNYYLQKK